MSRRTVNFEAMPLAHPPAIAWIKANGLDPWQVPQRQEVVIAGNTLTLKLFALHDDGSRAADIHNAPVFKTVTVPLLSDPEEHGIEARA